LLYFGLYSTFIELRLVPQRPLLLTPLLLTPPLLLQLLPPSGMDTRPGLSGKNEPGKIRSVSSTLKIFGKKQNLMRPDVPVKPYIPVPIPIRQNWSYQWWGRSSNKSTERRRWLWIWLWISIWRGLIGKPGLSWWGTEFKGVFQKSLFRN